MSRRQDRLLAHVTSLLERAGIRYWLESGTLLGAVREGDHLADHPRVDLGVESTQLEALLALGDRLGIGFAFERCQNRSGRAWIDGSVTGAEITRRLDRLRGLPEQVYVTVKYPTHGEHRWVDFRNCKSADSAHFEKLSEVALGGRRLPAPADPEGYLAHRYGDWKTARADWIGEIEDGAIAPDEVIHAVPPYVRTKPPGQLPKVTMEGKTKERMIAMFFRLVDVLEEARVQWWLEDGTLLGIIRDGDLIPWDHDMDISIRGEDAERIRGLRFRFPPHYLLVAQRTRHRWLPGPIRSLELHRSVEVVTRVNFHIDLLAKYRVGDHYRWIDSKALKHLETSWYDRLDTVEWRGRVLPTPNHVEDYLELRYPNWRVPVKELDTSLQDPTIAERGF